MRSRVGLEKLDRPRGADLVRLLEEAIALERANAHWTQRHAAAVTGYSETFLRRSNCPKHYEMLEGAKGKAKIVYIPAEVRSWKASRILPIEARVTRRIG